MFFILKNKKPFLKIVVKKTLNFYRLQIVSNALIKVYI